MMREDSAKSHNANHNTRSYPRRIGNIYYICIANHKKNQHYGEPTKEYHKAVIDVIKYISEGNSYVALKDGERLAGNYWPSVRDAFFETKAAIGLSNGDISVTQGHLLNPLYSDSEAAIERLEKTEADRKLDNRYKEENIKYGRKGYRISIVALILSIISIIVSIVK